MLLFLYDRLDVSPFFQAFRIAPGSYVSFGSGAVPGSVFPPEPGPAGPGVSEGPGETPGEGEAGGGEAGEGEAGGGEAGEGEAGGGEVGDEEAGAGGLSVAPVISGVEGDAVLSGSAVPGPAG